MKNPMMGAAAVAALGTYAMAQLVADYGGYVEHLLDEAAFLQTRDGEEAPSLVEIKEAVDAVQKLFETYKQKNDERIAQLEKRGSLDVLTNEEVTKVREELKVAKKTRDDLVALQTKLNRPGAMGGDVDGDRPTEAQLAHKQAFLNFVRKPDGHEQRAALHEAEKAAREERKAKAIAQGLDIKAVETAVEASGGFGVPELLDRRIEREMAEIAPLRNIVDVMPVGTTDYKKLVDLRGMAYGWVGEKDVRAETGTPALAEIAPTFGMIYAYPKATEESLDDIFFNVEQWLVNSALEAFDEGEENAIVNGNGTKKPTGILAAAQAAQVDGVRAFGTLEKLVTGATGAFDTTNPADDFRVLVYKLKKGYRRNARWLMNKLTAGTIMNFKDGQGNYLWQPAVTAGQPDVFMGYPVSESEEMPDVAAGATPVAFGDFRAGYMLNPLVGLRITKDEITEPGYVKWYIRKRIGGIVKLSEAIKLLEIAV